MVCLNSKNATEDSFLNMMNVLLSPDMSEEMKKRTLEKDYQIPMTSNLGEELSLMCNLSEYVEEAATKRVWKKVKSVH